MATFFTALYDGGQLRLEVLPLQRRVRLAFIDPHGAERAYMVFGANETRRLLVTLVKQAQDWGLGTWAPRKDAQ